MLAFTSGYDQEVKHWLSLLRTVELGGTTLCLQLRDLNLTFICLLVSFHANHTCFFGAYKPEPGLEN